MSAYLRCLGISTFIVSSLGMASAAFAEFKQAPLPYA